MKRIQLTTDRFGPGYYQEAGLEIELSDAEADIEIDRGRAKEVEAVVETAATERPANTAKRRPPNRAVKAPENRG